MSERRVRLEAIQAAEALRCLDQLTAMTDHLESSGTLLLLGAPVKLYTRTDILRWLRQMQYLARAEEFYPEAERAVDTPPGEVPEGGDEATE